MKTKEKQEKRIRRHKKVRAKIFGTAARPRLSVYRSNKHVFVQLIDDNKGVTLVSARDQEIPEKELKKAKGKVGRSFLVGKMIGQRALDKGIKEAVFDRGGYKYHGRVKAIAEGAREAGLKI